MKYSLFKVTMIEEMQEVEGEQVPVMVPSNEMVLVLESDDLSSLQSEISSDTTGATFYIEEFDGITSRVLS